MHARRALLYMPGDDEYKTKQADDVQKLSKILADFEKEQGCREIIVDNS